ncbi:MAG: hypothetical protein VKK42_07615 [Lyngbya sp.]|nr:hypothetical protein [Lyngbya sp.]
MLQSTLNSNRELGRPELGVGCRGDGGDGGVGSRESGVVMSGVVMSGDSNGRSQRVTGHCKLVW